MFKLPPFPTRLASFIAALALLAAGATAQARDTPAASGPASVAPAEEETFRPESGQSGKDVIWVPTPDDIVDAMLDMTRLKAGEVHFDLGSGDGKIVIAAAKRGARSTGVEYNPDMVGLSRRNAVRAGVADKATFIQGDIFEVDFSRADVVTLYLLPTLNMRLRPTLLKMAPGTRIASHQFSMGDWEPDERVTLNGRDALSWIVPADIAGTWEVAIDGSKAGPLTLVVNQHYQKAGGSANWGRANASLDEVRLSGGAIRFTVVDAQGVSHRFDGSAGHDGRMQGKVTDAKGSEAGFIAKRTMAVANPATIPVPVR